MITSLIMNNTIEINQQNLVLKIILFHPLQIFCWVKRLWLWLELRYILKFQHFAETSYWLYFLQSPLFLLIVVFTYVLSIYSIVVCGFYVPSARSFGDGPPNTVFCEGREARFFYRSHRAVVWQSITLPLRHSSSTTTPQYIVINRSCQWCWYLKSMF